MGTVFDDEIQWRTSDGRRARLRVDGARVEIDIAWTTGPECWTQELDDAAAARALVAAYRERLQQAGFAPVAMRGAALAPHAALRIAEVLRKDGLDSALADLIEADIAERPAQVAAAQKRLGTQGRSVGGGLPPLETGVSVHGGFVWAFDDDHRVGSHAKPDPVWEELEAVLRARSCRQIHVQVFGEWDCARAAVERARTVDALSHVLLTPLRATPVRGEPPPRLLALTGAWTALEPWLREPAAMPTLEALTLLNAHGRPGDWLDRLGALPELRHLGVWDLDEVQSLLRHPLIGRLDSLDLFSMKPGPILALVDAERDRLGKLRRLFLPGHLVTPDVRSQFNDLPARFVSHDRLEVLGHDLMRLGYPSGCR